MTAAQRTAPELWAGIECTINRVGDRAIDQLALLEVYDRDELVDAIAALGVSKVRWPALWERTAPKGLDAADWAWCDRTIPALLRRGIEPVLGLVHHGSGPLDTNLLDPEFPERLARYARACAERFPDVRHYTPINEPLTTARFSALYGHWYPHRRDDRAFVAALINQVRGVIEAMRAIREVRPDAVLVQTEDAGRTTATPELESQARFENDRRWLSLDLLMGRVDERHPLWWYLAAHGLDAGMAAYLRDNAQPPDIVGLNYYVTSDRYLDHRLARYPPSTHGGNGLDRYADLEAARTDDSVVRSHAEVLREAWDRYARPVALTEVHLGCTREEQLRWLRDAWQGAREATDAGADVRAVTAWALLGSTDWDSLVTRTAGHYEPGLFDARGATLRPTALAEATVALARGEALTHPAADGPGWWDRRSPAIARRRPLIVLGGGGTLGQAFRHACAHRGLECIALSRQELDVLDHQAVLDMVARHRPWAIVNATGYVRVDDAERDIRNCRQVNAVAPAMLAMACRKAGVRLITFSTDLVFDGLRTDPYCEQDAIGPLNMYGRSKAEGERRVLALNPRSLVVRTSAFFGPSDRANFVTIALEQLRARRPVRALSDVTVSPTYVPDLVHVTLDLLIDGAEGVWHLANRGAVTWFQLAELAARRAKVDTDTLSSCCSDAAQLAAVRPRYSVLGSARGSLMPPLEDALDRYVEQRKRIARAA